MHRYGKIIIIGIIIFLGIGLFYYENSQAIDQYPEYKIQTISGDESLVKDISITGSFNSTYLAKNLAVTTEGSKYSESQIDFKSMFTKSYDSEYEDDKIKEWIDKYRSFMRDKDPIITNFIETDDQLVYGDVYQDYSPFTGMSSEKKARVAILDKKTKKETTSFKIDFKESQGHDEYLEVIKIFLDGNQLKIIVDSQKYQETSDSQHIILYTFDLKKKKLVDEKELYGYKNNMDSNQTSLSIVPSNNEDDSKEIVFSISVYKEEEDDKGEYKTIDLKNEYVIYNYETDKMETIKIKEKDPLYDSEQIDDGILYSMTRKNKQLNINRVDLKEKKSLKPVIVKDLNIRDDVDEPIFSIVDDNYVILTGTYTDNYVPATDSKLNIIDLNSGDKIYEGMVVNQDKSYAADEADVSFYEILFEK